VEVVNGMEVQLNEHGTAKDVLRTHRLRSRRFAFDRALDGCSAQEETYAASAAPLVEYVLQGQGNATCFCYGATGTGKTYTMLGSNDQPGIMVLSLRDLFQHVATHPGVKVRGCPLPTVRRDRSAHDYKSTYSFIRYRLAEARAPPMPYVEAQSPLLTSSPLSSGTAVEVHGLFQVSMSYMEIYNELVRDLLQPGPTLELREETRGPHAGVVVAGLTRACTSSTQEVMAALHAGNARRTTEPTRANAVSSRSHAILQVCACHTSRHLLRCCRTVLI
jgi:kinesin family protein 18/19